MLSRCIISSQGLLPLMRSSGAALPRSFATGDQANKSTIETIRENVGKVVEKVGEAFQETGAVGKQFTPEGKAGGTAEKVGGPFHEDGAVGSKFTTEGPIGGTVEKGAEAVDKAGEVLQHDARKEQAVQSAKDKVAGP